METEQQGRFKEEGTRRVPVLVAVWAPWISRWKLTSAVSFVLRLVGWHHGFGSLLLAVGLERERKNRQQPKPCLAKRKQQPLLC